MASRAMPFPLPPRASDLDAKPWIYAPAEAQDFDKQGVITIPAKGGAAANALRFQVPKGRNGIVRAYANSYVGAGFTDGSGDLVWQILHDGTPFEGRSNILASLGAFNNPTYMALGLRLLENQVITWTVKNVGITVAGQLIEVRMMGWFYPKEYDNPKIMVRQ